jgi:hypothetical protein
VTDTQTAEKTDEEIAEEKARALEVYQVDSAMTPDMKDVVAYSKRIKHTIPGTKDLSDWGAIAYAEYGLATGANLARGELYAYEDRKGLHITEGYKLLVRWAKAKCEYSELFKPYDTDKGLGFKCYILRQDKVPLLQMLSDMMDKEQAFEMATSSAVGIVRTQELNGPPPNGWDWEQVAKKRALKNALNLAYGMPSPDELAAETWKVEDVTTIPTDWGGMHDDASPEEKRLNAKYNAKRRRNLREQATMTADEIKAESETIVDELFDYGVAEPPPEVENGHFEEPPPDDAEAPPHVWTREEATRLFNKTRNEYVIKDDDTLAALGVSQISDYPGDYDAALARIDVWVAAQAQAEAA